MNEFEKGLLKYLSEEQIKKIRDVKVGIAGCGGIGSNIANALVRTGFRDLELIDADVIEPNNLNRQNFYLEDVGYPKVAVMIENVKRINPDANIKGILIKLDKNNIKEHFQDSDILFEAFDNTESKQMLLEAFGNSGKLLIMCSGMAGIGNGKDIKIRKINDNLYIIGDGETDVRDGNPPLAPRVIACAALMASVALEFVLGNRK